MSKSDKCLKPNFNSQTGLYKVKDHWTGADEATCILKNGEYLTNPSAKNLKDFSVIDDKLHWPSGTPKEGQIVKGDLNYVIDKDGNTIIGDPKPFGDNGQKLFHPNLIGGVNPEVKAAGQIDIVKGKAVLIDNQSEHYHPSSETSPTVINAFKNIPKSEGYFRYKFKDY